MKRIWEFGRLFLFHPSKAADACAEKEALVAGLKIYALLAVAELFSSHFNPLLFLDPNAPVPAPHAVGFWLRVGLWEPILFGLNIFFTLLILEWMRAGWLPLKTACATFWSAIPVALCVYYASATTSLGQRFFIVVLAIWLLPALWLSRRIPGDRWRKVTAFLLGMSAIQLVCLAVEFATVVPARSKAGFYALSFVSIVWLMLCVGIGLRKLCAMSTARIVLAFLFAIFVSSIVPALAYLLGLMPKEVLKVVLYV